MPSWRGEPSLALTFSGVDVPGNTVQGQLAPAAVIVTLGPGFSRLALSSVARTRICRVPVVTGVKLKLQLLVPDAGCHVAPPSTDTSTPATTPPVSLAVPVTLTVPGTVAPGNGVLMTVTGAVVSVEAEAGTMPAARVPGCAPMSASRFTVACCMRRSVGAEPRSWTSSRPHDHWIVPAPNTSAPPGCR